MRANIMGEAGDILLDDLEGLLREINDFCTSSSNKPEEIPQSLEGYLSYVAKTGNTVFPWQHVRILFRNKILQSMDQFPGESCPASESLVMERFDLFRSAPFTIQRLAELITQPSRHYKKKGKFLNGLEKTVLVVSTVEPWSIDNDYRNGNDDANCSDGEMDQTYSESDEGGNRSFDSDQQDNMGMSDGPGDGNFMRVSAAISISIDNVTTTMVNITSNGSQSTAALMTSETAGQIDEMATSELGLSAVVTTNSTRPTASVGEQGANQVNDNFVPMEDNRLSDIVVTSGISGDGFGAGGALELTSVEVGPGSDNNTQDTTTVPERTLSSNEGSTLQMEHVEVQDLPSCQTAVREGEGSLGKSSESNEKEQGAMDVEMSVDDSKLVESTDKVVKLQNDMESLISTASQSTKESSSSVSNSEATSHTDSASGDGPQISSAGTPSTTPETSTSETKSVPAQEDQVSLTQVPVSEEGPVPPPTSNETSTTSSSDSTQANTTHPVPDVLTAEPPSSD